MPAEGLAVGHSAVEPQDLSVGLWPVGTGLVHLSAQVLASLSPGVGSVIPLFVGDHALDLDAAVGEGGYGARMDPDCGLRCLIVVDLGVRRQRAELSLSRLGDVQHHPTDHGQTHQGVPTPDQREGRALPADHARRMGVRPGLRLGDLTSQGPAPLVASLQSPPRTHRTRRQTPDHPRDQRPRAEHLAGAVLVEQHDEWAGAASASDP